MTFLFYQYAWVDVVMRNQELGDSIGSYHKDRDKLMEIDQENVRRLFY